MKSLKYIEANNHREHHTNFECYTFTGWSLLPVDNE
jgi:hypothetical protein